jgi:hypothetical protein
MGDLWLWENHSKRELRVLYKEEDLKEYENIKNEIRKAEQAGDFDYDRSVDKTLIRGIEQGFWGTNE